jgi:hypothetical protein
LKAHISIYSRGKAIAELPRAVAPFVGIFLPWVANVSPL